MSGSTVSPSPIERKSAPTPNRQLMTSFTSNSPDPNALQQFHASWQRATADPTYQREFQALKNGLGGKTNSIALCRLGFLTTSLHGFNPIDVVPDFLKPGFRRELTRADKFHFIAENLEREPDRAPGRQGGRETTPWPDFKEQVSVLYSTLDAVFESLAQAEALGRGRGRHQDRRAGSEDSLCPSPQSEPSSRRQSPHSPGGRSSPASGQNRRVNVADDKSPQPPKSKPASRRQSPQSPGVGFNPASGENRRVNVEDDLSFRRRQSPEPHKIQISGTSGQDRRVDTSALSPQSKLPPKKHQSPQPHDAKNFRTTGENRRVDVRDGASFLPPQRGASSSSPSSSPSRRRQQQPQQPHPQLPRGQLSRAFNPQDDD